MDPFNLHWLAQQEVPTSALVTFLVSILFVAFVFRLAVLTDNEEEPVGFSVPLPEQCNPGWQGRILENPSIKAPGSSAIQCYCPADGRLLGCLNPSTTDGIDRAIARAEKAQRDWAKTTFKERRRVLRTLLKYVLENQDSLATIACLDSGKTKIDAALGEILVTAEKLEWTIHHGEHALRSERRPTNFLMMYKYNEVRYEPLGVLAACVSWNYPFHNFISPAISTILTGSALVVKASEQTAWSTQHFSLIAKAALKACGHSPDLIQATVCWPETANYLTSHPSISHITFIGSRPVAHAVAASAAKSLTPLCIELGGKDPAIVLDDVRDLNRIASILMRGTFQSAGQNCIGIERIICLPKLYGRLVSILESRIRSLHVGNPLGGADETVQNTTSHGDENIDVGALISASRFPHLESLIRSAISEGARLLVGGSQFHDPAYPSGHYFSPTLLVDVTPDMAIANEELFAPICLVMRAATITEAINFANSTPYALGSSVFGQSPSDLENVVRGVRAGMVAVNDFGVTYAVGLPFGGVGGSGYGRFGGEEGVRSICNVKAVCKDRWAWMGVSTSIPLALDYPIKDVERGWRFVKGVIGVGYARGWDWLCSLGKVVRNA